MICAFDSTGKLCGYAPVYYSPATDSDSPHTFWTDIQIDLSLPIPGELRDTLLNKIKDRVEELAKMLPAGNKRLAFQYHVSEQDSIDYVQSKGGIFAESAFDFD